MTTTLTTLNHCKSVFYGSFFTDSDAEMEDFQVMWEAVLIRHNVPLPATWERFLHEINSKASDNYWHFAAIFNQHFKQ